MRKAGYQCSKNAICDFQHGPLFHRATSNIRSQPSFFPRVALCRLYRVKESLSEPPRSRPLAGWYEGDRLLQPRPGVGAIVIMHSRCSHLGSPCGSHQPHCRPWAAGGPPGSHRPSSSASSYNGETLERLQEGRNGVAARPTPCSTRPVQGPGHFTRVRATCRVRHYLLDVPIVEIHDPVHLCLCYTGGIVTCACLDIIRKIQRGFIYSFSIWLRPLQ